jgi:hypothetical protein
MDKYGRKVGVVYCATLSIIGGVCLCAAQNIAMFIVFRFFAGAGSWAFLALSTTPSSALPSYKGVGTQLIRICPSSTGILCRARPSQTPRLFCRHERHGHHLRLRHGLLHGPGILLCESASGSVARPSGPRPHFPHRHGLHVTYRPRIAPLAAHGRSRRGGTRDCHASASRQRRPGSGICPRRVLPDAETNRVRSDPQSDVEANVHQAELPQTKPPGVRIFVYWAEHCGVGDQ